MSVIRAIRPLHASRNIMTFMFYKNKKDLTRNVQNNIIITDKCVPFRYMEFYKKLKYPTSIQFVKLLPFP